jgi:hypothetical protein
MDGPALMTVEITLLDRNETIVIGGPPDEATAMQSKLATAMNVPFRQGMLLELSLGIGDIINVIIPICAEFPNVCWTFADEVSGLMIADGVATGYHHRA